MRTIFVFVASALLVGCANDTSSTTSCGPGQELVDLDGEQVCADAVHDVWGGGSTSQHYGTCTGSTNCATRANNHCGTHSGGCGYTYGTLYAQYGGTTCSYKCNCN
jgi:hypothetical protein